MVRVVLSLAFAVFLLAIVRGWYGATGTTPEKAMWEVGSIGMLALCYSAANSFNAMRHTLGQPARLVYIGLISSLLPLLVAVYSIAVYQYSPSKLTTFQIIAMVFGGLASVIDLALFSWLTFGHVRGGGERR